jgi:hypothetical protein
MTGRGIARWFTAAGGQNCRLCGADLAIDLPATDKEPPIDPV